MTAVDDLARAYLADPAVLGVFLSGSRVGGTGDESSDWDIVVLTDGQVDPGLRKRLTCEHDPNHVDLAPGHFGDGDSWHDDRGDVDVMFWDKAWLRGELERVITGHQPSLGYTTAHWKTVAGWSELGVSDRERVDSLNELAAREYSDKLRDRIIAHNYSVMRPALFSLEAQILKAVSRGDVVSVNHRLAALLASWFDIVVAASKVLHPGEKKLLTHRVSIIRIAQMRILRLFSPVT